MSASISKKIYKFVVAAFIIITLTGCGKLDKAGNAGLDKFFGNDGKQCSGLVC